MCLVHRILDDVVRLLQVSAAFVKFWKISFCSIFECFQVITKTFQDMSRCFVLVLLSYWLSLGASTNCTCEDALTASVIETAKNISVGESGEFCVCGSNDWSSSGYVVKEGESYTFEVEGDQTWTDYNHETTHLGYSNKWIKLMCCNDQWQDMSNYIGNLRFPSHPYWASLICCLGRIEDPTDTVSCFPILDSTSKVFSSIAGTAEDASTTIECYANDIVDFYGDNEGAINVKITRDS